MSYEVCPGRALRYSGTMYPAGALVPPGVDIEDLESSGVVRPVSSSAPPPRPKPKAVAAKAKPSAEGAVDSEFDASNPASVISVPLRLLPELLADIDDEALLRKMHEADTRKGGRDRIEERLGEIGVGSA